MIKILVGKMDGDLIIPIAEKDQMTMTGEPLPGDIVKIFRRVYICVEASASSQKPSPKVMYQDVTHAFKLLQGGG